ENNTSGLGARIRSMGIGGFEHIRISQAELRALADRADALEQERGAAYLAARELRAEVSELTRDRDRWRDSARYAVRQVEFVLDPLVHLHRSPVDRAVFIQDAPPPSARQSLDMSAADFRALGEPERIAVTITPTEETPDV